MAYPTNIDNVNDLYIVSNLCESVIVGPHNSTVTSINILDASIFPIIGLISVMTTGGKATLDNTEIIKYTGKTGNQLTGCTRGFGGSNPKTFVGDEVVILGISADHHNLLVQKIIDIQTELGINPKATYSDVATRLNEIESNPGVTTLIELTDTPSTYNGQAGKPLVCKTSEDGVEFGEVASTEYPYSFTNSTLVSGILTVTHNLGKVLCLCQVYDDQKRLVMPDEITLTNINSLSIDLSSFGTISGTWQVLVI